MHSIKKDHLALYIGFVMIMIVFVITVFRATDFRKTDAPKNDTADATTESEKIADYDTINSRDLQKKMLPISGNDNHILLDIREFEAYLSEHIIDAVNIPLSEFPVKDKLDSRKQIIVIGQNKYDQNIEKAVLELKKDDFKNVVVLAGGIDTWKQFLGPTVTYGDPESPADQAKVSFFDPEQLRDTLAANQPVFIIDVRSQENYNKGHIATAISIPFSELEKRRREITKRKVIVVGSNELEEFQAAVQIYDMLLISPFVMRTAMPGWESKGFELVKS